jgi:hypothetical protein
MATLASEKQEYTGADLASPQSMLNNVQRITGPGKSRLYGVDINRTRWWKFRLKKMYFC